MSTDHTDWQCGAPTPCGPCTGPIITGACDWPQHEHVASMVDPEVCPCDGCREWRTRAERAADE